MSSRSESAEVKGEFEEKSENGDESLTTNAKVDASSKHAEPKREERKGEQSSDEESGGGSKNDSDSDSDSDSDDYTTNLAPESPAASPKRGMKRIRERRDALVPNTMVAKLCEQAAERHEIRKKGGDEAEIGLCGITEKLGGVKGSKVEKYNSPETDSSPHKRRK